MNCLDEIAAAVHRVRRDVTWHIRNSVDVGNLLAPLTRSRWIEFQRALGIRLRDLEDGPGGPRVPALTDSIWDIATAMQHQLRGNIDPVSRTLEDWHEAQAFAGVRAILAESAALDPQNVHRDQRLIDLGLV